MKVSKFFGWIELYHNQTGVLVHVKVIVNMVSSKVDGPHYSGFSKISGEGNLLGEIFLVGGEWPNFRLVGGLPPSPPVGKTLLLWRKIPHGFFSQHWIPNVLRNPISGVLLLEVFPTGEINKKFSTAKIPH